jgi:hypothetical protein
MKTLLLATLLTVALVTAALGAQCQDISVSNVASSVTFNDPGCLVAYNTGATKAYVRLDGVAATTSDTPVPAQANNIPGLFGLCLVASNSASAITASSTTTVRVCDYPLH